MKNAEEIAKTYFTGVPFGEKNRSKWCFKQLLFTLIPEMKV